MLLGSSYGIFSSLGLSHRYLDYIAGSAPDSSP
jgi:hypothetical protein